MLYVIVCLWGNLEMVVASEQSSFETREEAQAYLDENIANGELATSELWTYEVQERDTAPPNIEVILLKRNDTVEGMGA